MRTRRFRLAVRTYRAVEADHDVAAAINILGRTGAALAGWLAADDEDEPSWIEAAAVDRQIPAVYSRAAISLDSNPWLLAVAVRQRS